MALCKKKPPAHQTAPMTGGFPLCRLTQLLHVLFPQLFPAVSRPFGLFPLQHFFEQRQMNMPTSQHVRESLRNPNRMGELQKTAFFLKATAPNVQRTRSQPLCTTCRQVCAEAQQLSLFPSSHLPYWQSAV